MNSHLKYDTEFNEYDTIRIDSYSFHSYIVSIIKVPSTKKLEYQVQYDSFTYNHLNNFDSYENEIKFFLKKFVLQHNDFCSFNQIYNHLSGDISNQLKLPKQLLIPVLLKSLDLEKLGPLLIDDQIDEIYLDSSKKSLYIDHSKHGRCTTSIKLTTKEIESFIYRVALENDFSLNKSNPTMKSDFVSSLFHTRVTVDIPPLTIEDYHIDIRKFRSNRLRIPDLVNNGSLTINQALLLIFLIQNQVSISIIGPPNSGKTTLQNALIEYIPSHLRLLSVEDVLETTETRQGNTVRFRLGYDPQENLVFSKSLEIQKILHRSPDFINLGELSTKNNFSAFLNVLSVGIPSIQTIHGRNPEFLFRRLKDIYEIPLELLKTSFPHIFIELNVSWIRNVKKRRIIRIAELTNEGKIETLPEEKFEFFLSHPNSESGISTLDFLITHNENGLNEAMTLSKNIVLELSQDTTSGF